jgi:hypothetical protein
MTAVAETSPEVFTLVNAALLLAARATAARFHLPQPKAAEILEATGATKSRAYEIARVIPAAIASLVRSPGRPLRPTPEPAPAAVDELQRKVIGYLIARPGCVTTGGSRHRYSDNYRRFVLDLAEQRGELDLGIFAEAVAVPLPTLHDWLRGGPLEHEEQPPDDETIAAQDAADARIETILHEWELWTGPFIPFCDHLRDHHRIEWGRTAIASILEKVGVRFPRRRTGQRHDDGTLDGAFETFFPGAQWEGDGSSISIRIGQQTFTFNVELMVDADSSAEVGLSIRDEEDSAAVVEAFADGTETTGAPPLALELDGRPANHTGEVDQALGETIRIRSTPAKPQSNPHVEGSFGLFQQAAPSLVIDAVDDTRKLARQILALVIVTWARTLNHKPRTDCAGRNRVDIYREAEPTEEDVDRARKALRDRARRQERMLETLRTGRDPVVRAVIDELWQHLHLDDPRGKVRDAISSFPLDAVISGIAICQGKRDVGTLPHNADARYLFGVVRNVSNQREGQAITETLLRIRIEARDVMLRRLIVARDRLLASTPNAHALLRDAVYRAMDTKRLLDRLFWLDLVADTIRDQDPERHTDLVKAASRRIHASFAVPYPDRLAAVRFLADKVIPLA